MNKEHHLLQNDLTIDDVAISHLKECLIWGKFLGIMGFVYSGVIAVSGIFTGIIFSGIWNIHSRRNIRIMEGGVILLIYLMGAAIIFFMSLYLFRFVKKMQTAVSTNNQEDLSDAFRNLKLYLRFAGIISIIALAVTVLAVVGMLIAATFNRY